jgi:hypothetical protein
VACNVANNSLKLENDDLRVYEAQDGTRSGLGSFPGGLEFSKFKLGGISFTVTDGRYRYFDLDGDGAIDGSYDGVTNCPQIVLDGRYVEVEQSKVGLSLRVIRSPDYKTTYVFEGGKWVVR